MPQAPCAALRSLALFAALVITLVAALTAQRVDIESKASTSEPGPDALSRIARPFFASYCTRCHGARRSKAGLRLDTIGYDLGDPARAEKWSTIQTMVQFTEMPPANAKKQPGLAERERFLDAVETALRRHGRGSYLDEKRHLPAYANFVDHSKLFDGSVTELPYTPARLWRRRPSIYHALWSREYGLKHRLQVKIGGKQRSGEIYTVHRGEQKGKAITARYFRKEQFATPFFEFVHHASGVTDYASIVADQASLEALMTNAEAMAEMLTTGTQVSISTEVKTKDSRRANNHGGFTGGDVSLRTVRRGRIPEAFQAIMDAGPGVKRAEFDEALTLAFDLFLRREPSTEERARHWQDLFRENLQLGSTMALQAVLIAIAISPEFVYRMELGLGQSDSHGRRMLSPSEIVYALHYAFYDTSPFGVKAYAASDIYQDEGEPIITKAMRDQRGLRLARDSWLVDVMRSGDLTTRKDVVNALRRIVAEKPRKMRRRRTDPTGIASTRHPRVLRFFREFFGYHKAPEVFKDLDKFARRPGFQQFGKGAAGRMVSDTDALVLHILNEDRDVLRELLTTSKVCLSGWSGDPKEKRVRRQGGKKKYALKHSTQAYNLDPFELDHPKGTPLEMPKDQRCGILTQPSWLVAHSGNFDNDPVRRGKWIREKLLAGYVLDVPITVQAVIPDDESKTLRQRFSVVHAGECWRCHKKMNPLGMPFEQFNHVGRFRKTEKGAPVDTLGSIDFSGDRSLDGEVKNVREMMEKLAGSDLVLRSFLRHVFRYWMGRNEALRDSKTLVAMEKAYKTNSGSFKAVLVALLASDSFLYRKIPR